MPRVQATSRLTGLFQDLLVGSLHLRDERPIQQPVDWRKEVVRNERSCKKKPHCSHDTYTKLSQMLGELHTLVVDFFCGH